MLSLSLSLSRSQSLSHTHIQQGSQRRTCRCTSVHVSYGCRVREKPYVSARGKGERSSQPSWGATYVKTPNKRHQLLPIVRPLFASGDNEPSQRLPEKNDRVKEPGVSV